MLHRVGPRLKKLCEMSTFEGSLLSLKDFQAGISTAESLEKGGRDGLVAKYVNEQSELASVQEIVAEKPRKQKQKTNFPLRSQNSNLAKFQSRISLKKAQAGAMFRNSRKSGIVKVGDHCIEIPKENPGTERELETFTSPHFENHGQRESQQSSIQDQTHDANNNDLMQPAVDKVVVDHRHFPRQDHQTQQNLDPRLQPSRPPSAQLQHLPLFNRNDRNFPIEPHYQDHQDPHAHNHELVNQNEPEVDIVQERERFSFDVEEFEEMFAPKQETDEMDIPQFFFPHRIY
jgi:hypothetical protein